MRSDVAKEAAVSAGRGRRAGSAHGGIARWAGPPGPAAGSHEPGVSASDCQLCARHQKLQGLRLREPRLWRASADKCWAPRTCTRTALGSRAAPVGHRHPFLCEQSAQSGFFLPWVLAHACPQCSPASPGHRRSSSGRSNSGPPGPSAAGAGLLVLPSPVEAPLVQSPEMCPAHHRHRFTGRLRCGRGAGSACSLGCGAGARPSGGAAVPPHPTAPALVLPSPRSWCACYPAALEGQLLLSRVQSAKPPQVTRLHV